MEVALHPEGVDRNSFPRVKLIVCARSPSTRRAWIEIEHQGTVDFAKLVALHPEGVDRNMQWLRICLHLRVALHPEGVDRNHTLNCIAVGLQTVALHPEGVDRNISELYNRTCKTVSPSTRRAWIEIGTADTPDTLPAQSPSTRRAWIETCTAVCIDIPVPVALHLKGAGRKQIVTLDSWT